MIDENPATDTDYQSIRSRLQAQRRQLDADTVHRMSQEMGQVFEQWFSQQEMSSRTCHIAAFAAIQQEPDLESLLASLTARGHHVSLPVIDNKEAPLSFYEWWPGQELVPAMLGTKEPPRDKPAGQLDIMLLPMLAHGENGERMGYGGGFYDRTLQALRASRQAPLAIGVTWEAQKLPSGYQAQPHDQPLDGVLTEKAIRFFGKR